MSTLNTTVEILKKILYSSDLLPLYYNSTALENDSVVATGVRTLYKIDVISTLGATQYIQLHDVAAVPANGVVPIAVYPIVANGSITITLPRGGMRFTTGLYICNSTTIGTKTLGADDCIFQVAYS